MVRLVAESVGGEGSVVGPDDSGNYGMDDTL